MPELSHLTRRERRQVLRSCRATYYLWAIIARSLFCGFIVAILFSLLLSSSAPITLRVLAIAVGGLLATAVFMQMQMIYTRALMRLQIMELLRGQKVPVCLECGYDQTANETNRCPECGALVTVPRDLNPLKTL